MLWWSSNKTVSLDIGASSIKVVELDVSRDSANLRSFGFVQTPPQSLIGGEIADPNAIAAAVKSLLAEIKTKRKSVVVGLWGSGVIVKKISIPRVEENLLADQIKWEAEQYIPFDIKEISLEFTVLKSSSTSETMDILLVAAKKPLVYRFMDIVAGCGLSCDIVDLSTFALANCYTFNYGRNPETVALLDIGSHVTNFAVVEEGQVLFCRDIPIGGFNFTSDISREMGVSLDEAESLKLASVSNQQVPEEVGNIIRHTTEVVADEVQNSFEFFKATSSNQAISRFYVTGGGAAMPGLADHIGQVTGASYEILNPFLRVSFDSKKFSPDYIEQIKLYCAVSIGLALRKVGDV